MQASEAVAKFADCSLVQLLTQLTTMSEPPLAMATVGHCLSEMCNLRLVQGAGSWMGSK